MDESPSSHDGEKIPEVRAKVAAMPDTTEEYIVDWDGPEDAENPRNWSARTKWAIVIMNSAITLCQAMSSTMIAPAIPQAMASFHSNDSVIAQLLVSIQVVGVAVGSLVLSPLSELHGRSPLMHVTNAAFMVAAIVCAAKPSIPVLIIGRLVMGMSTISIGGAYIADLMEPEDRGMALNVWNVGPVVAPIVGPIAGGYLALATDWRWTYGMLSIMGAFWLLVCLAVLPETYAPVLLELKAKKLRKMTGIDTYQSTYHGFGQLRASLLPSLARPWRMLIHCPMAVIISLFGAVAYSYMYFMFSTFTDVFESTYDFNSGEAGLAYLGLGIGSLIAQVAIHVHGKWQAKQRSTMGATIQPEHHLSLLVYAGVLMASGHVCYGWSLEYGLHWMLPIFGTALSGIGIVLVFQAVQAYLVEAYTLYAASAIALNIGIRCVFGLTVPLAGPRLYRELGYGWGNTLLAAFAVFMVPASLWLLKYGKKLREASLYSDASVGDSDA